jgi:hypothetical protein
MKVVTDFSVIANDPLYDAKAPCSVENYETLVFEYRFREISLCQFLDDGAKELCKQEHNHGWYMQTKDGARTLVGYDCGDDKLQASEKYQLDKRRIEAAQNETHCIERLDDIVADRPATSERLRSISSRIKGCRAKLDRLNVRIPRNIEHAVSNMSAGRAQVIVRIIDEKKNDKGKTIETNYIPFSLGAVQGARIFAQPSRVTRLEGAAFAIREALNDAVADPSQGIIKLQRWIKQIDALPKLDTDVSEVESEIRVYTDPDNLQRQIFLTDNWPDQIRMASLSIEYSGKSRKQDPEQLIHDYSAAIRAANRGRDFTI